MVKYSRDRLARVRGSQMEGCTADEAGGVAGGADHVKALANTIGRRFSAATEHAQGDMMALCCLLDLVERGDKFGLGSFRAWRQAQLHMQIVGTNKGDIDPRHREDLIEIFQRLGAFYLHADEDLVIGLLSVTPAVAETKAVWAKDAADAAHAQGRIFGPAHGLFGVGARVDHRDDNAPRACIERPLDPVDAILR